MATSLFNEEFLITQFGSKEAAQAVLCVYLEEEGKLVEPLQHSLQNDFKMNELDESAHKIKGSLDLIGAKGLSKLAADICEDCRNDRKEKAGANLADLCEGLERLRLEVEAYSKG